MHAAHGHTGTRGRIFFWDVSIRNSLRSNYFLIVDLAGGVFVLPCSACFDVFMTAGHNHVGASNYQGSLVKYMTPKMDERWTSFADLRYVIWCLHQPET